MHPVNQTFDTLILDLGDVLLDWSVDAATPIPLKQLRRAFTSSTWFDFERGLISQAECYRAVAEQLGTSAEDVAVTFDIARHTIRMRPDVVALVKELKPGRMVVAMSNIATPDWEFVCDTYAECEIFDQVFTSAAAGERKPDLAFFQHVLQQTGVDPRRAVFVDDKLENVFTARSLGITGIVYSDFPDLERRLRSVFGDTVQRAEAFMQANALKHLSYTSAGQIIRENFSPFLIIEATGDPSLVEYSVTPDGPQSFFLDETQYEHTPPPDIDTTSVAFTAAPHIVSDSVKHRVMDEIAANRNRDGILHVYVDSTRPRIDGVVSVNALTMFYTYGRGSEVQETLNWTLAILETRAYVDGTYYYSAPEAFLYFFSRLLRVAPEVRERIQPTFVERCRERMGMPGDALALAMRVLFCTEYGIDASGDALRLRDMQEADGSWKDGWLYKYPVQGLSVANRGVTTAFAINALKLAFGEGAK